MKPVFTRLALCVVVASCSETGVGYQIEQDSNHNFDTFYSRVATWPFELEPQTLNLLVERSRKLRLANSADEVRAQLGEPDVVESSFPVGDASKKILAWLYIARMTHQLPKGGEITAGVVVYFNANGELIALDSRGIAVRNVLTSDEFKKARRYQRYWTN